MKKAIITLNVALIIAILVGDICYMEFGGLALKTPTSVGFVLLGIVNLLWLVKSGAKEIKFPLLMVAGLTFAMIGDVFINIEFIAGALLFALGHVLYFLAYSRLMALKPADLIPSAVIFVVSVLVLTLSPILELDTVMLVLCIFYALVISLMVGKAFSNVMRQRSLPTVLLAIGSALFFFSDLMLVFDVFADVSHVFDTLCLVSYYPAQILLALSLFFVKPSKN